jgi:hypothetical protein
MADLTNQLQAAAGASTGVASDADFENTVLLLHGDGTNGAQNNTFIDSSTNNFTITRNGNTTQGTFTPFSKPDGRWGTYFAGGGSRLTITTISLASDFCIEGWFYIEPLADTYALLVGHDGTTGSSNDQFRVVRSSGAVGLIIDGSSTIADSGTAATLNAWHHIVACRSGTDCAVFVDGVRQGTGTSSGTFAATWIGDRNAASYDYMGYISNLRIVNGDSVYNPTSSSLTVPTGPLSDITDTDILTCSLNRFVDASAAATTVTPVGTVRVTPFSPFPITTAYSTSVNGGAGYFDGSGDYLSTPSASGIAMGTSDFCIDGWIYLTNTTNQMIVANSQSGGLWFGINVDNANRLALGRVFTAIDSEVSFSWTTHQWYHVAVNRSGTNVQFFVNGTQVGSTLTNSVNYPNQNNLTVGAESTGSAPFFGYISNLRLTKASVYTSGFTPPTAPTSAISGTGLLLNFTNAGIFDNTGFNALETVGNAQIDTSVKKYGTGSMEFDGTGDYLALPGSDSFILGSGNFTVEGWAYFTTIGGASVGRGLFQMSGTAGGFTTSLTTTAAVGSRASDGKWELYGGGGATAAASATPSINTWYHFALVKNGSNLTLYIDGVSTISKTDNTNYTGQYLVIGGYYTTTDVMAGFIDDLRITKGIARYTTTFTPPTAALPDIGA